MKITLISFTKKGAYICSKLTACLKEKGHLVTGYSKYGSHDLLLLEDNLHDFTRKAFETNQAIVFVGAAGIAVRAVAPFLISKAQDPAVVVVDEAGEYVIPILSGHLGGANELAEAIAHLLNGKAVITTATDINNVFSVDVWAKKNDLHIDNIENIKHISSTLLNDQRVGFCCDFPVDGLLPSFLTNEKADAGICIYNQIGGKRDTPPFPKTLFLRPKQFVVGIGCRRGAEKGILEEVFLETLSWLNIPLYLVNSVATIDIKKEEKAVTCLCDKYRYELKTYSSEELNGAKGNFTPSEFVRSITGVDNVCGRAASLASNDGELILRKTIKNSIAIAVAARSWRCSF